MGESAAEHDCVYATAGWQESDERAIGVLLDLGWTPVILSLGRDVDDVLALRQAAQDLGAGDRPVVAAPAVAGLLDGLPARVVPVALSVDLAAFPFHAPWIDAFLLGVPPHAHLVLSLRAHRPDTRVADIVEAFARIPRRVDVHEDFPDPYLLIGHGGPSTDAVRDLVAARGIADRTRLLGPVPAADLVPLLGRGACYVSASGEGPCPASLLQAMACGTPVIAAATPAVAEWVRAGETGFTYPVGDIDALRAVMSSVLETYPTEVVLRARALVEERGSWAVEAARLARVLGPR